MPVLYDKSREMLELGIDIAPSGNCFEAEFDQLNGAPKWLVLDCEDAWDEEETWMITVSHNVP
jgi:hypothetical protein